MKKLTGICLMIFTVIFLGEIAIFAQSETTNVHSFTVKNIEGQNISLAHYQGKVLLVVNTASNCGYTRQYKSLEALYQKYKDRGFEVLAFPANNFGGQEPGTNQQIKDFCLIKYKTTFPLFAKSSVKGPDMSPLYQYLTQENSVGQPISWNFNKYLVDANGNVIARFDSPVDPLSDQLVEKLESVLPK